MLGDAVKSVLGALGNKFKDYEIIISDGGSSDNTLEVAKKLILKNKKIKLVQNKNKGIGYSYWLALEKSNMQYFTFFPGDNENSGEDFGKTLQNIGKADIIAPYTINQEVRTFKRRLVSNTFVNIMNILFGLNLKYFTGNAIYKTTDLKKIELTAYSFAFSPELLIKMIRSGSSYLEYGIKIKPTNNTVIFKPKNIIEIVKTVIMLFYQVHISNRKKYRHIGKEVKLK